MAGLNTKDEAAAEAGKAGFDLNLIDLNLKLTHAERIDRHEQALALVREFDRIRRGRNAQPERPSFAPR
jgi:hypothetical protein